MRFTLTVLSIFLALVVGVFAEHDFGVVNLAKAETTRARTCCTCTAKEVPNCDCGEDCDCCPACVTQGGHGKCKCEHCKCCNGCPGSHK